MEQRRDLADDAALDPELAPIVAALRAKAQTRMALEAVTPAQMRIRAKAEFQSWNADPEPIALLRDFAVEGVPVRLYDPTPGEASGLLVYLHGGGWVIGDLDLEDAALRHIARRSGVRILSVDYRLAPEHRFPAQIDDAETVLRAAASGRAGLDADPARLALGGASAGATIALGTALRLRDDGGPLPAFLLLMYGAYAGGAASGSWTAFEDGRFGLPGNAMRWFWQTYAGGVTGRERGYAVPLDADLAGLPPVFLNHAGLDILRDDTVRLAEKLRASGVAVEHRGYAGAIHGFTQYARASGLARQALDTAADALAAALA